MRKLFLLASLSALSGCVLPPVPEQSALAVKPTTYHSVAYYDTHTLERSETNAWCRNNPGLSEKIPSCSSADTSDIHAWHRQMGWE